MADPSGADCESTLEWPAELRLLVHFTRDQDDPALVHVLDDHARFAEIDWARFTTLAAHHRVECLVALNIDRHYPRMIPERVRDNFSRKLQRHGIEALWLARSTAALIDALNAANIPALVLKGAAVAGRYYRDLNARQSIDTDILVARPNIERAHLIIEELGFERYEPSFMPPPGCEDIYFDLVNAISYRHRDTGGQLDLHWRLFKNPHLLPWELEDVGPFSGTMTLAGVDVDVLRPGALSVYLCCHGANHAWFRLKWLADIYRLVSALSEDEVAEMADLARLSQTQQVVAAGFRATMRVYGIPIRKALRPLLDDARAAELDIGYPLAKLMSSEEQGDVGLGNLPTILGDYHYLSSFKSSFAYKGWTLIGLLCDIRCVERLRLGRKWLPAYIVLCPMIALLRIVARTFDL